MTESNSEFPKAYDPGVAESKWYDVWEKAGYFRPEARPDGEPYCIALPPPNVTGSLHMGHAFEHALIDATIRRRRMQGYAALWLPGTDHAGIATQNVVERQLAEEGISRHDLGRAAFLERVWKWKEIAGGQILSQMRRMGNSCDWSRTKFTMDPDLSRAVREAFVRLYKEGLIYRGDRIINWCPRCRTALSDIEVDHKDVEGELVEVRYPGADGSLEKGVVVATTRVETMLGDTAVAVHPKDPRYRELVGSEVILPIRNKRIPVVEDEAVDPEFGTGAVKVTPGHDPTDFEIGERHGLPIVNIFNEDATLNEEGEAFAGLERFEARRKVKEELYRLGLVVSEKPYVHAVGHCQRCDTQVEPIVSKQWFVKVKPLSEPALQAVLEGRTKFFPDRWVKVYKDWLENIRDWCISRQLWWGHQIPVFYCRGCGAEICESEDPDSCPRCGSTYLEQDPDVLDTWFSSALWPFSTLGWPDDTEDLRRFYPNSMLHTGFDIIFFWVARMMQMGIHFMGEVPFYHVAYHGLIRDAKGRKMSKSFGNVIDPLELADRYGADALRWALTRAASPGQDVPLAEEWVEGARHFLNKLWNACRFVWLSLDGQAIADLSDSNGESALAPGGKEPVNETGANDDGRGSGATRGAISRLDLPTRWIYSRLSKTIQRVDVAYDEYNFADALRALQHFVWSEFCDWYIELAKPNLGLGGESRKAQQEALARLVDAILRLLHPAIPFVTEEIWSRLGGSGHLIVAEWPDPSAFQTDDEAEARMEAVQEVVSVVRRFRSSHQIAPSAKLEAAVCARSERQASDLAELKGRIEPLAGLASLEIFVGSPPEGAWQTSSSVLRLATAHGEVLVETTGVLDIAKERQRLEKQLRKLDEQISRSVKKLENQQFVQRAPADVVEAEREKLASLRSAREVAAEALAELG